MISFWGISNEEIAAVEYAEPRDSYLESFNEKLLLEDQIIELYENEVNSYLFSLHEEKTKNLEFDMPTEERIREIGFLGASLGLKNKKATLSRVNILNEHLVYSVSFNEGRNWFNFYIIGESQDGGLGFQISKMDSRFPAFIEGRIIEDLNTAIEDGFDDYAEDFLIASRLKTVKFVEGAILLQYKSDLEVEN